jgi:hypothetical protein
MSKNIVLSTTILERKLKRMKAKDIDLIQELITTLGIHTCSILGKLALE